MGGTERLQGKQSLAHCGHNSPFPAAPLPAPADITCLAVLWLL